MAVSKKTGGTKKTSTKTNRSGKKGSSSTGRKASPAVSEKNSLLKKEAVTLLFLAFCIFLLAGLFHAGGKAGSLFAGWLFGLFGLMAYIVPVISFIGFAAVVFSKKTGRVKTCFAAVLFICLTAFVQLVAAGYDAQTGLGRYFKLSMEQHTGGGLTGAAVCAVLLPLLGKAGAYIVLVAVSAVSIVFITERSMIRPIQKGSEKAYADARSRIEKRKQERTAARQYRLAQRQTEPGAGTTGRLSGVSFETKLKWPDGEAGAAMEDPLAKKSQNSPVKNYDEKKENISTPSLFDAPLFEEKIQPARPESLKNEASMPDRIDFPVKEQNRSDRKEDNEAGEQKRTRRKKNAGADENIDQLTQQVEEEISDRSGEKTYTAPPLSLLVKGDNRQGDSQAHLQQTALKLEQTLANFGVNVRVTNASCGPSVTRYELQPEMGVKVSRIVSLADDIKLNLAVADLRIEAPIPGKAAVGIEIPNKENSPVMLRDLLESSEFHKMSSNLAFAVGKDIAGKTMVADIAKMPHLLVAGATGSGKSVCINTLIMSLIYKSSPDEVKLIMVDPKMVELSVYNGIPHLLIPVVTDPKKAAGALNWAVAEMMKRYKLFSQYNVRDLKGYNTLSARIGDEAPEKMPQIVIIVDELADLMMVAPQEVEGAICRLAQLARAAGIHLIIATQRPSVNVITGLIKANMPSRIAFAVSSGVDSRTIIDMNGAEKLLGRGDMLFSPSNLPKPVRVQGSFVSDKEVFDVVRYLKEEHGETSYSSELEQEMANHVQTSPAAGPGGIDHAPEDERDVYFEDAGWAIIDKERASIGMLQRLFKIGFNRAARIMDQLTEAGVVGPEEGTKPRKILMSKEEFGQYLQGDQEGTDSE